MLGQWEKIEYVRCLALTHGRTC